VTIMMNDKDLKRNASGYVDEPCYKAVTAPPRPGEIWIHGKSGAQMLVLANINGICPTLRLVDVSGEGSVSVTGKTLMYAKPYMIGYCFENLLTEFVKSVKGEEMAAVRRGMVKSMGLFDEVTQNNPMPEEYKALEGKRQAQIVENMYLRNENKSLKAQHEEAWGKLPEAMEKEFNETYAKLKEEILKLSIYKDMYMDIIGKLVALRGGAVNE
jgi:hypothetical protein